MGSLNDRNNSGATNSSQRAGEIGRLKAGAQGTMEELHEFLGQMRGKSPQQVLGLVAASGLTMGIVWSTLATFVVLMIFTAGPYFVYGDVAAKEAAAKKAKAEAAAAEKAEEEAASEAAAEQAAAEESNTVNKETAVKAMTQEFEEAKGTSPDDVPDVDNLLDSLE